MEENMIVIRGPKTFYFDFDWSMKLNLSQKAMNL